MILYNRNLKFAKYRKISVKLLAKSYFNHETGNEKLNPRLMNL